MGLNISRLKEFVGKDEELDTLKEMNDTLKELSSTVEKTTGLQMSGLLGNVLGANQNQNTAAEQSTDEIKSNAGAGEKVYEEVIYEGERMIAETNAKTGKVNDLLTVQEAQQRGILDENGKIKKNLTKENSAFDILTKNLQNQDGIVVLTNKQLLEISTLHYERILLDSEFNKVMQETIDKLREKYLNGSSSEEDKKQIDRTISQIEIMNDMNSALNSFMSSTGVGQFVSYGTDWARAIMEENKFKPIDFTSNILFGSDAPGG